MLRVCVCITDFNLGTEEAVSWSSRWYTQQAVETALLRSGSDFRHCIFSEWKPIFIYGVLRVAYSVVV